jgi:hypothetical protein
MRTKDQILLEEKYLQTKNIIKEQNESQYSSKVPLTVYTEEMEGETFNLDHPKSIGVDYNIEIDFKSYGIRGIDVSFNSADSFYAEVVKWGEDKDEVTDVYIDLSGLSNVTCEFSVGDRGDVFPKEFEIFVDKEFKPISAKLIF